jgi:subtilisin family serine protease
MLGILPAAFLMFCLLVFHLPAAFSAYDIAAFNKESAERFQSMVDRFLDIKEAAKKRLDTIPQDAYAERLDEFRIQIADWLVEPLRKLLEEMLRVDPCDLEKLAGLLEELNSIEYTFSGFYRMEVPYEKRIAAKYVVDTGMGRLSQIFSDVRYLEGIEHAAGRAIREQIRQYPENCKKKQAVAAIPSDTGKTEKNKKKEKKEAVNKAKLKITDASGRPKDGVVIEVPPDDAPPEKPIKTVEKDEPINPDSGYIVDLPCHKAVKIKGKDLIEKGGVQLKHTPKRYRIAWSGDAEFGDPQRMYEDVKKIANDIEFGPNDFGFVQHSEGIPPYYEIVITNWRPKHCIKPQETPRRYRVAADNIPDTGKPEGIYEDVKKIANDIEFGPKDYVLECHFDVSPPYCEIIVKKWCPKDQGACGAVTAAPKPDTISKDGQLTPAPDVPKQTPTDDDPGVDDVPLIPLPPGTVIIIGDDPSGIQQADKFPNDPFFLSRGSWGETYFDQWGLRRIGFKPGTAKQSLWPEKASPVVVAVIDTGIDMFHPELLGAIWRNKKEIPNNGIDDDKNGYVDDVYGWNFVDKNNDIRDINGHGTVTSGIIAAWPNNRIGIAGVNPWAQIMPVKAMEWNGRGWAFDIADAVKYAADNGARVINISLGGKKLNRAQMMAVKYARDRGVIIVAAAGNEGENTDNFSPAGLPGIVTVAATGPDDRRVGYSSWGHGVDIAAPGVDILSLRARRTDLLTFEKKDYKPGTAFVGKDKRYYRITGTSFAAPYVSGVASLILSIHPELTDKQVIRMILHSAEDIDIPGWDQFTGYGLLDARAALKADPDFYVISRISKVGGMRQDGRFVIGISGRAMADKFSRAWIEAGEGQDPTQWKKVSEDMTAPVNRGLLALVSPEHFRGASTWTLRLVVEHENGSKRMSTYDLKLK